jgi:hypothetical protein
LSFGHMRRSLEHEVFDKMRDAGFAGVLVRRAEFIPDHMRDDRRAMIGDHDHLQAVFQGESFRIKVFRLGGGYGQQQAEKGDRYYFKKTHDLCYNWFMSTIINREKS